MSVSFIGKQIHVKILVFLVLCGSCPPHPRRSMTATGLTHGETSWVAYSPQFPFLSCYFFLMVFQNRVSTQPSSPGTHRVDHAGLKLKSPPTSVNQVQGLEGCITTTCPTFSFLLSVVHQTEVTKVLTLEMSRQSPWKPHYLGVSLIIT